MSSNADLLNAALPYVTNAGLGLVFGVGYALIKYIYGEDKTATPDEKEKANMTMWDNATTIEQINCLIKHSEEDSKLNPFEVLEIIKKKSLSPDINTYNNLLNACYIVQNFSIAEKLKEEIFEYGSSITPDLSTYNIILKGISCKLETDLQIFEKEDLLEQAYKYFNEVEAKGLKYSDITVNTMLDILIKAGENQKAWELFDNMQEKYSIEPDKYSYSTIIKALKYDEDPSKIEKAFGILDYLRKKNISVNDEIIFNCLLEVCIKFKMMEKAEKLYEEMKLIGVIPSKITYAIMIRGYGQIYNLEKAFAIFQEMKASDCKPNEVIYGCILNTCVRCANIQKANEVYQEMQREKVVMNIILYTTLIKGYAKAKDLDKCLEVYNQMLADENVTPNIVIHNAMLDACVECQNKEKMDEIYQSIRQKALENENAPSPDLITYSTVIKGYCRAKDMEKALSIYKNLQEQENQFTLDEVIYNSILDGCVKTKMYEKALEIREDMREHHIKLSNVTYSILVKLFANNGENDKAFEILEEMRHEGIKPGIIVYTCLIQCSLKSGNFKKAIELFETLKSEGLKADYVLYNTIVNGCLYHSQWEQACEYTLESFKKNVKMAINIYRNVLDKLTMKYCYMNINSKINYATNILKNLKDRGIEIDDDTYKRVTQMIYKNNSTEREQGNSGNYYYNSNKRYNNNNSGKKFKNYNNFK